MEIQQNQHDEKYLSPSMPGPKNDWIYMTIFSNVCVCVCGVLCVCVIIRHQGPLRQTVSMKYGAKPKKMKRWNKENIQTRV